MATTLPPGNAANAGGAASASLQLDLSQLQAAPAAAKTAAQGVAKELAAAERESQRAQAAAEKQRTAELKAALTQRKVAVKAAKREETEAARAAEREQAALEKEHTAVLKAALRQRVVAVKAAKREEVAAEKAAAAQRRAIQQGVATFAGSALGGPLGGIAGAVAGGGTTGLALAAGLAVNQGARFASEQAQIAVQAASDLTESINKVGVAFGSSSQEIIKWSQNSATALGQSRQQALEAASSFGLLFRTMGIAPAESAQMSQALVQLAADMASINNITPEDALTKLRAGLVGEIEPLRTVGVLLDAATTEAKAMEMGLAATRGELTQQDKVMARYQLILEQTALTQGDFARTSGEAANQQRILDAQTADFHAELGKTLLPSYITLLVAATTAMKGLSDATHAQQQFAENNAAAWGTMAQAIRTALAVANPMLGVLSGIAGVFGGINQGRILYQQRQAEQQFLVGVGNYQRNQGITPQGGGGARTGYSAEQQALFVQRLESLAKIDADAAKQRIAATEQYESQRTGIISGYEKSTAREAEDFARQRLGAERKLNLAILDVASASARQRAKWEEELTRNNAKLVSESNDKIAELRADANKQLVKLDEDYQADRERAALDHRDTLMDAASRLDAVAVMAEQKRYAREQADAEKAYKEERKDTQDQLDERIAEEKDALDESLRQAQEAHQRQLDEQAENDRLRIADMQAAFEEQKRQEDDERAIRLGRQAQDHQDQLNELARSHNNRLQQINQQAAEERKQYEVEFEKALADNDIKTARWIASQAKLTDAAIKEFDRWFKHVEETVKGTASADAGVSTGTGPMLSRASGGPIYRTGPVRAHAGEFVLSAPTVRSLSGGMGNFDQASLIDAVRGGGRSFTWTGNMSISIPGGTSASADELAAVFEPLLMRSLEKIASQ